MAKKKRTKWKTEGEDTRSSSQKRNTVASSLTDPLFRKRVEKPKKGKGSYNRKNSEVDSE